LKFAETRTVILCSGRLVSAITPSAPIEREATISVRSAAPRTWGITLPDLASRVQAASVATLDALDDALLAALLAKLFADRQITPPPRLIDYCLRRMERSFAAAQALVAALDARSLAEGRPIGPSLAAEILDNPAGLAR
jgi:chromosomal replication initiation ATPase DnaA